MKKAFSYIFTIVLVIATAWIILANIKPSEIPYLLYKTNRSFIFLAVMCMVLYWFMDALIIKVTSRMVGVRSSIGRSLKITLVGQYYTEITPYAVGCQPAQVYTMMNYSVPLGKATSIVIDKFVIYQITLTLYSGTALLLRHNFIYNSTRGLFAFIVGVLMLHLAGTLVLIVLFLNPKIIEAAIYFILSILHRFKFLKDIDDSRAKAVSHLKEYTDSINKIKSSPGTALIAFIMTIIQLSSYFAIAYFIFQGLGMRRMLFLDVITLQSLLYMMVAVVPTPGTIGASEGGFYILFRAFASANIMTYATLLWSLINYYLNLITGGVVTLISRTLSHKKAPEGA